MRRSSTFVIVENSIMPTRENANVPPMRPTLQGLGAWHATSLISGMKTPRNVHPVLQALFLI